MLAALLGLVFGPHLAGDWLWDDVYLVRENPNVEGGLGGLRGLLTHDLWGSAGQAASDLYHPVPMAVMWLVSKAAGHAIVAFRSLNVALHAGCTLLLAAWMRRRGLPMWGVIFASLFFAVHPLVTEPVMWITGCHDTLAALGCLTALCVWPRAGDERVLGRVALAALATGWAALCKEPYFAFPLVLLLATVCDTAPGRHRGERVVWPAIAVGLVVLLRRQLGIRTGSAQAQASLGTHLVDYATIIFHYLRAVLTFQNGPTTESFRPLSGPAAAGVLALALAVTGLLWARMRTRAPATDVAFVGWGWFLLALAPHTIATPLIGMYGNRYAYFPMMGLFVAAASACRPLAALVSVRPWRALRAVPPVSLLALAPFTAAEASLWRDEVTLFGADVKRDPDDPRALYHYGHAVQVREGCAAALPFFARATERDPTYGRAWHNVAGCLVDLRRYGEALPAAETAHRLQPGDAGAAYNLAVARLATGDPDGGRALLEEALSLDPRHAGARRLLALLPVPVAPSPGGGQ